MKPKTSRPLSLKEREARDEKRREREMQRRRTQRCKTTGRDVVPLVELPDRSNRQVSLAEFSEAMRKCPELRKLADA